MELTANSKVYIMCPGNAHTGGPTLLHQLGARLQADGVDVAMYYYPVSTKSSVHPHYRHYSLPVAECIEVGIDNILIVPETLIFLVPRDLRIQRVVWWLSVDNWWSRVRRYVECYDETVESFAVKPLPFLGVLDSPSFMHWTQSEYARQFLLINDVPQERIFEVGDYLDEVFLTRNKTLVKAGRKNIVAFNPRKGWEFTRKLIEKSMDLAWRPVENMTPTQVEEFLHSVKVYVDFGNHPGKDRIPREAVMAGCCLLTGKRGAAANDVDIPIPSDLKFDDTEENIPAIVAKIRELLANYEQEVERLADYRHKISQEPELFTRQVRAALGYKQKNVAQELILSLDAGGGTEVFLQGYLQNNASRNIVLLRPHQAPKDKAEWQAFVYEHNINHIVVNHLLGFPLYETMTALSQLGMSYTVFLHDYFCMCPNTSLDCRALYCHGYRSHEYCRYIFNVRGMKDINLEEYRRRFYDFLLGADKVIAPTHYAAGIINSLYHDVNITVNPHKLQNNYKRTFKRDFAQEETLTLAFLGTFCTQKGARYFLQLNSWIKRRKLPVRLIVIGEDAGDLNGDRQGIFFTGRYVQSDVSRLLALYQTAIVLIPSACPETYCYTASEAILSGYPVLTMNLGAQALRVQKADCGWIINRDTPDRGQLSLQRLVRYFLTPKGRQEILKKAVNTQNFHNGME
ncbi:glycosyltransferase [Selenomonas ruminantium]|uniref:glycosyltransferase n=1 Tax=Selenomonas ruminantium TaxID=971 RepID=UPI00047B5309|nr:glycosyltransferase [Selenomonas ruminantium]